MTDIRPSEDFQPWPAPTLGVAPHPFVAQPEAEARPLVRWRAVLGGVSGVIVVAIIAFVFYAILTGGTYRY